MKTITKPSKKKVVRLSEVTRAKLNTSVDNKSRFYRGAIDNHLVGQDHFEAVYTLTNILRSMERKMASKPGLDGDEQVQLNSTCKQLVRSLKKARLSLNMPSNRMCAQRILDKYNQLMITSLEKMMDAQAEYMRALNSQRPITINRMGATLSRLMGDASGQAILRDYLTLSKESPAAHTKSFYIFSASIAVK